MHSMPRWRACTLARRQGLEPVTRHACGLQGDCRRASADGQGAAVGRITRATVWVSTASVWGIPVKHGPWGGRDAGFGCAVAGLFSRGGLSAAACGAGTCGRGGRAAVTPPGPAQETSGLNHDASHYCRWRRSVGRNWHAGHRRWPSSLRIDPGCRVISAAARRWAQSAPVSSVAQRVLLAGLLTLPWLWPFTAGPVAVTQPYPA